MPATVYCYVVLEKPSGASLVRNTDAAVIDYLFEHLQKSGGLLLFVWMDPNNTGRHGLLYILDRREICMGLFSKAEDVQERLLPKHLGIIMDGNGRWAKKRGLPRTAGHTVGAQNFRTITKYCSSIGIPFLTVYAFSTENWKRPAEEVSSLMKLFKQYLEEALRDFQEENIRVRFLGDTTAFSPDLQELIARVEKDSAPKTGMVLNIAMNYGGRDEILLAAKELAREVKEGRLLPDDIDEKAISDRLYTAGQPDPDLIIRPSGENRISNFLLWQSAYAEYIIMNVLWPDFKKSDLDNALEEFSRRNRRFGGI